MMLKKMVRIHVPDCFIKEISLNGQKGSEYLMNIIISFQFQRKL